MEEIIIKLDRMQEQLSKIMEIIVGDLSDTSKPGFHTRLDRLEQSNRQKNRIIGWLGMGVFTSLGSAIILLISKFT